MSFAALNQPSFLFGITNDFLFDDDTVSEKDIFSWDNDSSEQHDQDSQSTNSDNPFQFQIKEKEKKPLQLPKGLGHQSFQSNTELFPTFNLFSTMNVSFASNFPRAQDYSSQESILKTFPHLQGVNDPKFNPNSIPNNAQFYILRSSNDDNIHKAVKYQIWSTTAAGKAILSEAWNEFLKQGMLPEIYLIFTVVNTNQCLGVAKMTADVNPNETFMFWWEPTKWFGTFKIQWLFLKDIHSSQFEHIKEEAFSTSSFINLKDSTKLTNANGKEIIRIFNEYSLRSNIFESFAYMDQREDYIRLQRENNSYFLKHFQECCVAYQKDPEGFSPQKKSQQHKKKFSNNNINLSGQKIQLPQTEEKGFNNKPTTSKNSTNAKKNQGSKSKNQNKTQNSTKQPSLAEQFGIKTLSKKSKGQKSNRNPQIIEKTHETKKENMTLTY